MRFIMQPHKPNADYAYDGGHALIDTLDGRQVGWFARPERCRQSMDERNQQEPQTMVQSNNSPKGEDAA